MRHSVILIFLLVTVVTSVAKSLMDCGCVNNTTLDGNKCYCDEESRKINACLRSIAPNWPFKHPQNGVPESLPEARNIFHDCVVSSGAVPHVVYNATTMSKTTQTETPASHPTQESPSIVLDNDKSLPARSSSCCTRVDYTMLVIYVVQIVAFVALWN